MRPLLAFLFILSLPGALSAQKAKADVFARIDAGRSAYDDLALKIWDFAEVGYREHRSSALLQERLRQEGFKVESGVAGIPTAFIASAGSGSPVIGVLAEFDALPGASQEAVPEKKPRPGATAGHACGQVETGHQKAGNERMGGAARIQLHPVLRQPDEHRDKTEKQKEQWL